MAKKRNNIKKMVLSFRSDNNSIFSFLNKCYEKIKIHRDLNMFLDIFSKEEILAKIRNDVFLTKKNKKLFGIPFFCKDNLAYKDHFLTVGSKFLKNYFCPYNAEVIERLEKWGAICLGKTNQDELSLGKSGENEFFGNIKNPWNENYHVGGSSGGSALAVSLDIVPFALGSDTGDSIRRPAAYCGIIGFKPSYGIVSRWGLVPFAPSLDTIGIFTKYISDCKLIFNCISGFDIKDPSLLRLKLKPQKRKNFKVVIFKEIFINSPLNFKNYWKVIFKIFKKLKISYEIIDFPKDILSLLPILYLIISYPEAVSSQSNLQGILFGNVSQEDIDKEYKIIIKNTRTNNFGFEVKKRYFIGRYLELIEEKTNFIEKAHKTRGFIVDYLKNNIFKRFDFIVNFTNFENLSKKYKKSFSNNDLAINALSLANFAGLPSLTLPIPLLNNNKERVNFLINGSHFSDKNVLYFAGMLEREFSI